MRNAISRALTWALHLITPGRGQRRDSAKPTIHHPAIAEGRHRATAEPAPRTRNPERIAVPLQGLRDPFERIPGHAPGLPPIPPFRPRYVALAERFAAARWEERQQHERQLTAAAATTSTDYPYTYPDALMIPATVAETAVSA
ncbi:hypothetical protein [Streptomyces uncialis]|uniref:hypothetical protein n=1 Tax=Streptomyces uncialis TaxID=1048205 RepID=UPI00224F4802|nr:hypothetical protein [Streptomyces uncialis]MCX4663381.1 hypothetical protein [Streptomyces uncialis]